MSLDFPRRARVAKGVLVAIGSGSRRPIIDQNTNMFVFQYNPEMLTRTLSYPDHEEAAIDDEKARYTQGLPIELINLTLELDVTDQLEEPEQHLDIVKNGLHPSLSALESMMYPQFHSGRPTEPPVVLFIWGPKRIVPVRLTSLKVSEEAFDQNLNPIRAKIDLCMKVLNRSELKKGSLGYDIYGNHLKKKGSLALLYRQSSLSREYLERISRDVHQYLQRNIPNRRE